MIFHAFDTTKRKAPNMKERH